MKICISGKGGTGKTTLAGTLSRLFGRDGYKVLAIDADPNTTLASALGIPPETAEKIIPISENKELIKERTGTQPGSSWGVFFNLVPDVRDIKDKFSIQAPDSVSLLVTGTIEFGGGGCFCPAAALLKTLLSYLIVREKDVVIVDMEAGLEHLGRGVTKEFDVLLIVVEPSLKSLETAEKIRKLAEDLSIKEVFVVPNKVSTKEQSRRIKEYLSNKGFEEIGEIPYDTNVIEADMVGKALLDYNPNSKAVKAIKKIYQGLVKLNQH